MRSRGGGVRPGVGTPSLYRKSGAWVTADTEEGRLDKKLVNYPKKGGFGLGVGGPGQSRWRTVLVGTVKRNQRVRSVGEGRPGLSLPINGSTTCGG